MGTERPGRDADTDLYIRCLAYIEADQLADAERQARRIEHATLRAIAMDQIRSVLEIKACLANGDRDHAVRLTRSLIGGIKLKYETALGIHPDPRPPPPPSSRLGEKKPYAGRAGRRPQPDPTDLPPALGGIVEQLTRIIGRGRTGERRPDFSPAVLLELGWIAHRAWRRPGVGKSLSPLRAGSSEIRITGACLRQRIEEGGGRLSNEDLSREMGVSRTYVATGARNLRQFLLQGSGWRMIGDAKTGFALEPEDPNP